jgi:hypothetical protein
MNLRWLSYAELIHARWVAIYQQPLQANWRHFR